MKEIYSQTFLSYIFEKIEISKETEDLIKYLNTMLNFF